MSLTGAPGFRRRAGGGVRRRLGMGILLAAAHPGTLALRMENVVPAEHGTADAPAGPYAAMAMDLCRD